MVVEGTGDDLVLLLLGELDEVHRIAGDADGQLRIALRMLLRVQQGFLGEHIHIQVVAALLYVAVQQGDEVINLIIRSRHGLSPFDDNGLHALVQIFKERGRKACAVRALQIHFDVAGEDLVFLAQRARDDGERVGNTVLARSWRIFF